MRVTTLRNGVGIILSTLIASALLLSNATMAADEDKANTMPKVIIETSEGNIEVLLRPDVAPKTVRNFLTYADDDFYQGTVFHRVIPGFMIQGGGFTEAMDNKAVREPVELEAKPTVKNLRGTLAMARTNNPDSATSQFFINLVDNDFLNAGTNGPGYTVFGRVTSGMGVVDSIASTPTGRHQAMGDVPKTPVVINAIRRLDD
ncbi:MAG: peptidylprolyl isomerase [Oleiphilaceae bacterium]|nr:peptidylprolyl isomerase [Oleiphilaceae bacterium]